MNTPSEPRDVATRLFMETWVEGPSHVASAPGRVNLIGEHTDYNDGFVLPMAINRRTAVALGPGSEARSFVSADGPGPVTVTGPSFGPQPDQSWVNYPLGVMAQFESLGRRFGPIRVAVASTVPIGSGLSSSAALEAATATALAAYLGVHPARPDIALLCQKAEHEYAGVRCGIMDQMVSVLGYAVMLDCRTYEAAEVRLPEEVRVVILDSGIPRGLSSSAYNERRGQCEEGVAVMRKRWPEVTALRDVTVERLEASRKSLSGVVYRRCRHVVTENARVLAAADALRDHDLHAFGGLLAASHASMRDDYEISLPEMDRLVEIAADAEGCYGARLTGAGFGGAAVALVRADRADVFARHVMDRYRAETGRDGRAMLVTADEGARIEPAV